MKSLFFIAAGLLALCVSDLHAASEDPVILHVATDGNDAWSGGLERPNGDRTDGPLATLAGARDRVRRLKKEWGEILAAPVRVIIAPGIYPLDKAVVFTHEDSGTAKFPVTYEAAGRDRPLFSGGRRLEGFNVDKDGLWTCRLPEAAEGGPSFTQLLVGGIRAQRARSPNDAYYRAAGVEEEVIEEGSGRTAKFARRRLAARPGDIDPLFLLSGQDLRKTTITVLHKWDVTRRSIDAVIPKENVVVTSGGGMKPWNPWKADSRFYLENFRVALDAPGEWHLGGDGVLAYIPRPGQNPANTEAVYPAIDRFLTFEGDSAGGRPVEHLRFERLAFHHARDPLAGGPFEPSQAAHPVEAAIMADGARGIAIVDCEVRHTGGYGIWFRRGCRNCRVERCLLEDLGAGGIRIGEGSIASDPNDHTGEITVDNCIIRSGGRIYPPAVGIWIGQSGSNTVTHNDIGDLFYTGISIGWRWGYAESLAKGNRVEFNHIHDIGQGMLSDMGGIYTLGPSQGTTVSGNHIHHVRSHGYGGWGLYNDEGSTGIVMENNLVHDTKSGGYHQHYGRENVIRNNIFACASEQQLQFTRVEKHRSFTFERNIVYFERGKLLAGPWAAGDVMMRNNLYWRADGKPFDFVGKTLEEWQAAGRDAGSLVVEPLFRDPAARDFSLEDESPAVRIGFKPFDLSLPGVYGDPEWIELARSVPAPPR